MKKLGIFFTALMILTLTVSTGLCVESAECKKWQESAEIVATKFAEGKTLKEVCDSSLLDENALKICNTVKYEVQKWLNPVVGKPMSPKQAAFMALVKCESLQEEAVSKKQKTQ